ncbi:MAG: methylmalonyl-CoA mutase family protein [Chloroflexi bacterium]|nr:methylmalonyl-CoA mutase family protein [Chloroflexota bacterium]MCK4580706.1 methylmalonyl-CoA mutase family protein [Dehalococcoidia bacterium]
MASSSKQEWRKSTLAPILERFSERQGKFETTSGIELDTVYVPEDLADFDYASQLGYPGEYPFTRGVQPNMYRGRLWTIREYAGFGTAEDTNARYKKLLAEGQTGLSVAFHLPTQIGYDSDHPLARGEVGKVGVAIDTLRDMEILFQDIPLDKVSTSMTINATAAILLAMYIALGRKQGVEAARLNGTVQNDTLKDYIARGTYIFPPRPSMRLITDIISYCAKNVPRWNSVSISGYHIREAGSTAVQEIAFTLANGIAYVQAAIDAGLDVDSFAPRLSFFLNSHINFFEEVAKFRAARRLWARIMRERFGAKDERSCMLRFHTQTAGVSLVAQQPLNNIIRAALQALAATMGGTQSLHTDSYDEAYATPSEDAVTIAVRTQQVIGYESGIPDVVDPLGGSYYIEYLTDRIERGASEYIARIDDLGGAVAGIEEGFQQREIQDASYKYQMMIEQGKQTIVGVNKFVSGYSKIANMLRFDPEVERKQKERLAQVKQERDSARVKRALERLADVARSDENTLPSLLECVEAYATVGEMTDTLREVFGTQREFLSF